MWISQLQMFQSWDGIEEYCHDSSLSRDPRGKLFVEIGPRPAIGKLFFIKLKVGYASIVVGVLRIIRFH